MQRLFSTFPGGWPGLGLLLLRGAAGAAMMARGLGSLSAESATPWTLVVGLLASAAGAGLLLGLLTPAAGAATGLVSLGALVARLAPGAAGALPPVSADILLAVVGVAVALLGPGALSLDARLFGRREIVFPRAGERRPPPELPPSP